MADMFTPMGPRVTRANAAPGTQKIMLGSAPNTIVLQGAYGFPSYGQRVPTPQHSPLRVVDGVAGDMGGFPLHQPVEVIRRFSMTRHYLPVFLLALVLIFVICWLTMGFEREDVDPVTGAHVKVVDPSKIIYAVLFSVGGACVVMLLMAGYEHGRAL